MPEAPASLAELQTVVPEVGIENSASYFTIGNPLEEPRFLSRILCAPRMHLLLDLHNLYANSVNFGMDPADFLRRLPSERIHAVHISGGKWIGRILDDHLHDPPDPVYDLLTALAARSPNPLTVILERDGAYPPMTQLLAQLDRARSALELGRERLAA